MPPTPVLGAVRTPVASPGFWMPQALLCLSAFVLSLLQPLQNPEDKVLAGLICLAAAVTPRWPLAGSVTVGIVLTVWFFSPPPTLAAITFTGPLVVMGVLGRLRLRLLLTFWYLPMVTYPIVTFGGQGTPGELAMGTAIAVILVAITWFLGDVLRRLQGQVVEAQRARAEAVRAERLALARDLHDAVAATNARVVMRAQQAELRGIDDPSLAQDITYIQGAARQTASYLNSMLQALRSTAPPEGTPSPPDPWHIRSLKGALDERAALLREHGFAVTLATHVDETQLSSVARDVLGKSLIETTSNVIKYARPHSTCHILVSEEPDGVELMVGSELPPSAGRSLQGNGLGLQGIRERVQAFGGEFDVTPTATEWLVRVYIPTRGAQ